MKIFKKLVSVLVASCFMLSIANLPAVADVYDNTSYENSSETYYTQTYTTPAQAAAKASSGSKKVKSTKKKTTKKKQSKKKVTTKAVNNLVKQNVNLIKTLLKGKSGLTKKWLTEAKKYINSIKKNKKSNNATKYKLLQKTLKTLKAIQKKQCSTLSIVNETLKKGSVFSSLKKTVLEKDTTYKLYTGINNSIDKLLKKDISEEQKSYFKEIKTLVYNKMFGKDSDVTKTKYLQSVQNSINNIEKGNVSISSMEKEFKGNGIFSSLWKSFENSTMYQIYKVYKDVGFNVFYKLSKYVKLSIKAVYDSFVKMDVNEEQIGKGGSLLSTLINRGVNFLNCASNAVSKFLGISRPLAAVMNLAAHISMDVDGFINSYKDEYTLIGTSRDAQMKTLQKNGHERVIRYSLDVIDFMADSPVGKKALLHLASLDENGTRRGGHVIAIVKENEKEFSVSDNLINQGNKIIYSEEEFKKFLNGEVATGKTTDGMVIVKPLFFNTTGGLRQYKPEYKTTDITNLQEEIYEKYNKDGLLTIKGLADKLNISQEIIYNQFVSLNINKADMLLVSNFFEKYKKEEDCINLMYNYCVSYRGSYGLNDNGNYVSSNTTRIANALKSLMEFYNLGLAA